MARLVGRVATAPFRAVGRFVFGPTNHYVAPLRFRQQVFFNHQYPQQVVFNPFRTQRLYYNQAQEQFQGTCNQQQQFRYVQREFAPQQFQYNPQYIQREVVQQEIVQPQCQTQQFRIQREVAVPQQCSPQQLQYSPQQLPELIGPPNVDCGCNRTGQLRASFRYN